MKLKNWSLIRAARKGALVASLLLAGEAFAANHALILWVGDYGRTDLNLPGIQQDAANARRIAAAMGVPSTNTREVANRAVTREAFLRELSALTNRINRGDKVFIYYSGHGYQEAGVGGAACTESIVTQEPALLYDVELQAALQRLGEKAGQVVMMNDSCFSGGAATKGAGTRSLDGGVAKFFPGDVKGSSAITQSYQCGQALNKSGMTRNLEVLAARTDGPRVLYIAAANDTEVAFATGEGSVATTAWLRCLEGANADTNRSGGINGEELRACAQRYINERTRFRQTIVLQGEPNLPLSFTATSDRPDATPVDAVNALHDLRALASKGHEVTLSTARSELRIRQDFLDFSVTTSRPGYLYLLQVGSDGKTFNVLFPNQLDRNNSVQAGTHTFPRPAWRIRAGGPAGTSHIMAIVTPTFKDLTKDMDWRSTFATAAATANSLKTLVVEATGAAGGSGEFGASAVMAIRETP